MLDSTIVAVNTNASACGTLVEGTATYKGKAIRWRGCHSDLVYVRVGQQVKEGQKIARMSDTGNAQGKHLHFILWVSGRRVDPDKWIKEQMETDMPDIIDATYKHELRRVMAEVKGWDSAKVYTGQYDASELKAWKGQEFRKYFNSSWDSGDAYRRLKAAWKAAYETGGEEAAIGKSVIKLMGSFGYTKGS